jgi:hypothetical protein
MTTREQIMNRKTQFIKRNKQASKQTNEQTKNTIRISSHEYRRRSEENSISVSSWYTFSFPSTLTRMLGPYSSDFKQSIMDRNLKKGKRGENQRKQTKEKKQQRKTEK